MLAKISKQAQPDARPSIIDEAALRQAAEALLAGAGSSALQAAIRVGEDPLGEAFARIRPAARRRALGATYTPPEIVRSMLGWAAAQHVPIARIVDPGAGSGRFLLAVAALFPEATLIGIEIDPLVALLLRANLAAAGLAHRAEVIEGDYRDAALAPIAGGTLFIGNPPYLRHHGIAPEWKRWYAETARRFGVAASKLAGLHLHFFLRTLELARPGDLGCFVTAAEWFEVNYGAALRQLLAGPLGAVAIHRLDAKALPFADAVTTGAIVCFRPGTVSQHVQIREVASAQALGDLSAGEPVARSAILIARPRRDLPAGWSELGEFCRVHRGQVTGANDIWIAGPMSAGLPERYLFSTITKARELIVAGDALHDASALRRVVDLPLDFDEGEEIGRFLAWAKAQGADRSYIARHRKAWWSVGLRAPAPILCTYMARRAPAFVRNLCAARHINIAHGLYPRDAIDGAMLDALAAWLRANVAQSAGRTYAGGLTKFEPKELERIAVPPFADLTVASPAG